MRNGTSRVPCEKNEDSYVGSTPASTNMFEGDSDEEQASLFPTRFARHVNRSETSCVPYEKKEDSHVESTPSSTIEFEGGYDEEQAGLFPTGYGRSGTPYPLRC